VSRTGEGTGGVLWVKKRGGEDRKGQLQDRVGKGLRKKPVGSRGCQVKGVLGEGCSTLRARRVGRAFWWAQPNHLIFFHERVKKGEKNGQGLCDLPRTQGRGDEGRLLIQYGETNDRVLEQRGQSRNEKRKSNSPET